MSPTDAIHSSIFQTYLAIVIAILLVAGSVLAILQFVAGKSVRTIWLTYAGWLIMIPTIALAIFLGRWPVIAGTAALAMFGFREFGRATGMSREPWVSPLVCLLILGSAAAAGFRRFDLFLAFPVIAISLLAIVPVLRNQTGGQLRTTALSAFGFLYAGWMFMHLAFLANTTNPYGNLIYLIFATEVNDVAAFTTGRLLGRRRLRSNVSPRKTWGGAVGALAVSMLLPWVLRFSLPDFSAARLLIAGVIVGVGGQLGDLVVSVIKRDLGIKDMGAAIPGHGGILDRIDSLIFVAPPFLYLVRYGSGSP